jgi:hypothetical protein
MAAYLTPVQTILIATGSKLMEAADSIHDCVDEDMYEDVIKFIAYDCLNPSNFDSCMSEHELSLEVSICFHSQNVRGWISEVQKW